MSTSVVPVTAPPKDYVIFGGLIFLVLADLDMRKAEVELSGNAGRMGNTPVLSFEEVTLG